MSSNTSSNSITLDDNTKMNILKDWLTYGTVLVAIQLFKSFIGNPYAGEARPDYFTGVPNIGTGSASMMASPFGASTQRGMQQLGGGFEAVFSKDFLSATLFLILGYTIYDLVVKKMTQFSPNNQVVQSIIDDGIKFTLGYAVLQLLSGRKFDEEWIKMTVFMVAGFGVYDGLLYKVVPKDSNYKNLLNTLLKVSTMLLVQRLLMGGSITDEKWIKNILYILGGFAIYELVVKQFVPKIMGREDPENFAIEQYSD